MRDIKITTEKKLIRLSIARSICQINPPILASRLRTWVYPREIGIQDNAELSVRSLTGSILKSWTSDYHGYELLVQGYYQWRLLAIALSIFSSQETIIEVGANVGTETIGFSDIVGSRGTVIAFEPAPLNYDSLHETLQINNIQNVQLYPYAAGLEEGIVRFLVPMSRAVSGSGRVLPDSEQEKVLNSVEVRCVPLDDFLPHINRTTAIFMDAEGSELFILKGSREIINRDRPAIVLEASHKHLSRFGQNLVDLYSLLNDYGYKNFRLERLGLKKFTPSLSDPASNWVCLHETRIRDYQKIVKTIRLCGLLPPFSWVHPLKNIRRVH